MNYPIEILIASGKYGEFSSWKSLDMSGIILSKLFYGTYCFYKQTAIPIFE